MACPEATRVSTYLGDTAAQIASPAGLFPIREAVVRSPVRTMPA